MKIKSKVLAWAAALGVARIGFGATNDLTSSLQKGLFEEEANHNYPAAIQAYQDVIDRFDQERKLGATALFRLSEVYRKQGKTNEANALSQRIVREFADQSALAGLSQAYLAGAGGTGAVANAASESTETRPSSEQEEIKRVQAMIKESPDLINARDQSGRTPLHHAAIDGQLLVAQFLLENGADVDAKETQSSQASALQLAAEQGHKAMVELLLQKGANVGTVSSGNVTALHFAARKGFRSIAEVLVAHKADVNAKTDKGGTPLHWAVANGFKATAEFLLDHGADPNLDCSEIHRDSGPRLSGTSLHVAVILEDQSMIELLLAHQADPNFRSVQRSQETPLHIAAQNGDEKAVAAMLAAGGKPDVEKSDGETPLDVAAARDHLPIAVLLVSHGADVNRRNRGQVWPGWTPLHWTIASHGTKVAQFLIEKGADINARIERVSGGQPAGATPLYYAAATGNAMMLDLLLEHKADPNIPIEYGDMPIIAAIRLSDAGIRKRMVAALLDHGADVNTRDSEGKTLLMISAETKDKPIFDVVLAHKPDVNAKISYGASALHFLASSLGRSEGSKEDVLPMAEELIAAGADVNLRDKYGRTPLKLIPIPSQATPTPGLPGGYGYNFATPPLRAPTPIAPGTTFQDRLARLRAGATAPPNSTTVSPSETTSIEERLAKLLRDHGALDDLPDFSLIRVTRKGFSSPISVASRDTNGVNRFSILEVIAEYYGRPINPGGSPGAELPFPDVGGIRILRPDPDMSGKKQEIPLSLLSSANTFDCAKDQWLEFGDVIEIPEREHPLSEPHIGLTSEQSKDLSDCLQRKVRFIIRNRESEVTLSGYISRNDTYLSQAMQIKTVQNLLRSTSDLSRVKVRRPQTDTNKEQQFTVDVASFWRGGKSVIDDLWLRNGDIIEVQDKVQQAEK